MNRVVDYVVKAFLNRRRTQTMFGGQNCNNLAAKLVLHTVQLPGDIRLVDSQQTSDLTELQALLVAPKENESLAWREGLAGCRE